MVDALTWVLAGVVIYWLAVAVLRSRDLLPDSVGAQGPLLTLHTRRGIALLEWLAGPKRFWRAWANFGVGVALMVMAGAFVYLTQAALLSLRQSEGSPVTQPRNVLVIPGVNDFLPLSVAPEIVLGLLVALVVHEGGHGLLCRVEDIDIDSMGLAFLTLIPIGAFVEPDEESRLLASRGAQTRMFAAGVTNNFAITLVAYALLFGPVAGSIAVAPGAPIGGVFPGSAAADAGIAQGDRIVEVAGETVADEGAVAAVLANTTGERVSVTLADGDEREVRRSLLVTATAPAAPPDLGTNATIVAVNGTPVRTEAAFRAALANRTVATVTTASGATSTFPAGSFVGVTPNDPLAAAGAPAGGTMVVTTIGGERVVSTADLQRVLVDTSPGDVVTVEAYVDGERRTYEVTLGSQPGGDDGFLGVSPEPGVSGLEVSDLGVRWYPAGLYLGLLGGGDGGTGGVPVAQSFPGRVFLALLLPVGGVIGLPFNFAGFTGGVGAFYTTTEPLGFLGGGVFVLANVLFWTGWINLNLGFFNCIPAFPLDGGHILRMSTEAVVSRLPVERGRELTRTVTTAVGLLMLAALLLMLFGPQLL